MLVPSMNPMITEDQLLQRLEELGAEIAKDLSAMGEITVVGLLRGSFVFLADLVRSLSRHNVTVQEIDFIIASSYGSSTNSSENVKIERDLKNDIRDRNVLLIDDILDTGFTLQRVVDLLKSRGPRNLRTCVMLDKPSRRIASIEADYVGFNIEDRFVVGYGLDYDQRYRELPFVTMLEERG